MNINSEKLFRLKQELNMFLEKHPELCDFQKLIDYKLNMHGKDKLKRMNELEAMMRIHLDKLRYHLKQL